jgi:hypothetical protein
VILFVNINLMLSQYIKLIVKVMRMRMRMIVIVKKSYSSDSKGMSKTMFWLYLSLSKFQEI